MCHLGWPMRTERRRGPEQRESQPRVRADTPGAIVLIKKLRPIRWCHKRRGRAEHHFPSWRTPPWARAPYHAGIAWRQAIRVNCAALSD